MTIYEVTAHRDVEIEARRPGVKERTVIRLKAEESMLVAELIATKAVDAEGVRHDVALPIDIGKAVKVADLCTVKREF